MTILGTFWYCAHLIFLEFVEQIVHILCVGNLAVAGGADLLGQLVQKRQGSVDHHLVIIQLQTAIKFKGLANIVANVMVHFQDYSDIFLQFY